MANVYTVEMFSGTVPAGVTVDVVVPTGFVYVLTSLDVFTNITGFSSAELHVRDSGTSASFWWYIKNSSDLDGRGTAQWRGNQAFTPTGFTFDVSGNDIDIRASGYQLALP